MGDRQPWVVMVVILRGYWVASLMEGQRCWSKLNCLGTTTASHFIRDEFYPSAPMNPLEYNVHGGCLISTQEVQFILIIKSIHT